MAGCPYCSGYLCAPETSLGALHPELAAELVEADAFTLQPGSSKKVEWRCIVKPYHQWKTAVSNRVGAGTGCPYCAGVKLHRLDSLGALHPELAAQLRDRDPMTVHPGSPRKERWQCVKDARHTWKARTDSRTGPKAHGCPYCSGRLTLREESLAALHPDLLKEWDWERNGTKDPWALGPQSHYHAAWRCSADPTHRWRAIVGNRVRKGNRCGSCRAVRSLPELLLAHELGGLTDLDSSLRKLETDHGEREVDLAWPGVQVALEYDGWYWHQDKEKQDRWKGEQLAERGWTLIRVRALPLSKISDTDLLVDHTWEPLRLVQEVARHLHAVLGEQVVSTAALTELEMRTELVEENAARAEWDRLREVRPLKPLRKPRKTRREPRDQRPVRQAALLSMEAAKSGPGVTVQEIVKAQGWPMGSVYSLLKEMTEKGLLVRTGTHRRRWHVPPA